MLWVNSYWHCQPIAHSPPPPLIRQSNWVVTKKPISQTRIPSLWMINDSDDTDCTTSSEVPITLPSHVNLITSPSNPFVKHCLKLRQSSSYRRSHASALVVGSTPIREISDLEKSKHERHIRMDYIFLLDKAEVPEWIESLSVRIVNVSSMVMRKLSGVQSTESIEAIALMRIPSTFHHLNDNLQEPDCEMWFPSARRMLVLDGIQDPGNLGTLVRSAVAFGWDGVFLLPGCCDPFNDKTLRASRGSSFKLPIVSGDWFHLESLRKKFRLRMLAGHPQFDEQQKAAVQLSHKLVDSLADEALCLVLGSEGSGLSEMSKRVCELVSIPMEGDFESLNVSVAGGIFMFMLQPKKQRTA
ncbi:tRNA/rRNA methyltransferase, SpoU type [Dillenia turbinata]|uniref:tRNA/rRNA methyltransferase, SpoU type n=1 Tax=Dillenia turbinata TaxID=194707 RepID=A0AAN8V2T2_9MAGN